MKNCTLIIVCYITMAFLSSVFGQTTIRKCASPKVNPSYEETFQQMLVKHEMFSRNKKALTVYTIPVIFHIIHSGQAVGTTYNISQAQVNSQIAILNQDFRKTNTDFATTVTQSAFLSAAADCEIVFCAAQVSPTGTVLAEPGIERIQASTKGWTNPGYTDSYIENTIKPNSIWDPTKYCNIWILAFSDGLTLGYAQFPTIPAGTNPITDMVGWGDAANTDGVVFDYRYVGNVGTATYPFNKGRTATHEIGHWLGLWHINGDVSCGNDYCADTPAQSSLTSGCPSTTGGVSAAGCGTASPNPPGKMYQNFMDYSDDRCLTMFTNGQKARMQAVMANCVRRLSLTTSTVCAIPAGLNEASLNIQLDIYPNPTGGELFVKVSTTDVVNFTINVVNVLGQTVYETKQYQSNTEKIKIDLSSNNKGVYFINIKSKSGTTVKRIVLE